MPQSMARGRGRNNGNGPKGRQDGKVVEEAVQKDCPLCIEPLDPYERDFYPCPCGYQVCLFCYDRLRQLYKNQCPGCREPYSDKPVDKPLHVSEANVVEPPQSAPDPPPEAAQSSMRPAAEPPGRPPAPHSPKHAARNPPPRQTAHPAKERPPLNGKHVPPNGQTEHAIPYPNGANHVNGRVPINGYNMHPPPGYGQQLTEPQPPRVQATTYQQAVSQAPGHAPSQPPSFHPTFQQRPVGAQAAIPLNGSTGPRAQPELAGGDMLLSALQKGASNHAGSEQAHKENRMNQQQQQTHGPRAQQDAGSSSLPRAYPQVNVGDLAGVGYQSLQWYLKSSGADVESVMRTDRQHNAAGEGKFSRFGSYWGDVDAFDNGGSRFSLQEQALWGCTSLADKLQEQPLVPPRLNGHVPLYERAFTKAELAERNGGGPPGFPPVQQHVPVNGDSGRSYYQRVVNK